MQPSKFFSVTIFRTRFFRQSRVRTWAVAIFSNAEKFRCLYSHYGSCMPSSPKEYISPWFKVVVYPSYNDIHDIFLSEISSQRSRH